jgi:orotidine-5'-phosphate decarboxylase
VTTPSEAVSSGADHIVVGRPILEAKDKIAAVEAIIAEL